LQDAELSFNNLVYINLAGRSLVTIPVVLHQHADTIVSLRLSRNPMIDIPLDFIQSCTALSELYLSHMCMKKPPHSVAHIATLTLLDLSSNRIASLDEAALDELPRLTTLDIQNNRLERLPRALPRSLLNLNISNNKFDAFPVNVTELAHLSRLDISFNTISELPREIGRLTRLTKLVIVGNQISALPNEFGNLALLSELDCRRNQIADLAVACGLPELAFLSADHNNLHTLALPLGPRLQALDVSHNDITELPLARDTFTLPSALTCLDISNAKLSVLDEGTLSQLPSLRNLRLDRNLFRTLPESLGDLKWLESLSCADNALSKLPESVGKLQKLESLDLHNNSLTALPPSLWNCASLLRLNVTSNLLLVWHDPPSSIPDEPPPIPIGRLLPSPTFSPRRPSVSSSPDIPPLAHSLEMLYLAENSLTDESLHPLMILKALRVLNLSLNDIQELPSDFFKDLTQLEEVFLSGNRLTHIPSQDLPRLERLSTLFLNGNHLQHLPHELGQVKSLVLLDVGNNLLKYNINNLDYDWNWWVGSCALWPYTDRACRNFNKNLVYLNLSGNEKLQIKSDVSGHGRPSISSIQRQSLAGFSGLPRLRVLGLMDVTITNTGMNTGSDIPDETDDRRVRTSSSLVNGLSYGIADTLGKNRHPHMMDLVHEFRGLQKDTVFAMVSLSARYTHSTMLNLFIVWSIPPSEPDGRDHLQQPPKISERQLHSRFHLPTQLP
jgi:adenylate cyclase